MPTPEQQTALEQPFPPEKIRSREGNSGQTLEYIEAHEIIQRLNDAFGGDWSFEVVEFHLHEDIGEAVVLGKLTAGGIVKTQFGSSKLTRKRGSNDLVSLGDDLKSATSDAIKKAATLLGIGLHLYRDDVPESRHAPAAQQDRRHPGAYREPLPTAGQLPASEPASDSRAAHTTTGRTSGGSQGRLSAKQHDLILKVAGERGMTQADLKAHCQKQFGRTVDYLTKANASALIAALLAGQVVKAA